MQHVFATAFDRDFAGFQHDTDEPHDTGHGRTEYRCCTVLHTTEGIRQAGDRQGLTPIGMCISERTVNGKTQGDVRYFIGSTKASANVDARSWRNHWSIENNLHRQLDVTIREDDHRFQRRQGVENPELMRRLALVLLKAHPAKMSMAMKRAMRLHSTSVFSKKS